MMEILEKGKKWLLYRNQINSNFTELFTKKPPTFILLSGTVLNLTNQLEAESFLGSANSLVIRPTLDTTTYTQVRIGARVNVASTSPNSPRLYLKYTTSLALSPSFTLIGDGTVLSAQAVSLSSQGQRLTDWISLPSEAISESITFQMFQAGGDGDKDPQLTSVWLELK